MKTIMMIQSSLLCLLLTTSIISIKGERFQAVDSSHEDVSSFNVIEQNVMKSWKTELEKMKALSENVPCTTKFLAQITWPSGVSPASGSKVKFDNIQVKPKVIWPCYGSKLYGMVFADMEALANADPMTREYLWLVCNIPGNQVDKGIEIVPYRIPDMKKDTGTIMILIHEQTRPVEFDTANLSEGTKADKTILAAFESFNGTLTAGNMFTVEKCKTIISKKKRSASRCYNLPEYHLLITQKSLLGTVQVITKQNERIIQCSILLTAIHIIYGGVYEDYYHLKEKLTEMKVIGEILPCSTKYFANVSWPSGVTANLGNIVSLSEIQEKPTVTWPYNPKKKYLILFTDMDDAFNADPIMKEFQLWFVYDIPGIDIEKGKEEYEYILPDLRNQFHRVSVIVMQQRENVNMSQSIFGVGARHNWTALELMYEFSGSLHASNVYVVKPE